MKPLIGTVLGEGSDVLSEASAKALLDAYGIRVTEPLPAPDADDAVATAARIGYPVVLKIRSPDISHKTDVGGVATGIDTPDEVRAAYERIVGSVAERMPEAVCAG